MKNKENKSLHELWIYKQSSLTEWLLIFSIVVAIFLELKMPLWSSYNLTVLTRFSKCEMFYGLQEPLFQSSVLPSIGMPEYKTSSDRESVLKQHFKVLCKIYI